MYIQRANRRNRRWESDGVKTFTEFIFRITSIHFKLILGKLGSGTVAPAPYAQFRLIFLSEICF